MLEVKQSIFQTKIVLKEIELYGFKGEVLEVSSIPNLILSLKSNK